MLHGCVALTLLCVSVAQASLFETQSFACTVLQLPFHDRPVSSPTATQVQGYLRIFEGLEWLDPASLPHCASDSLLVLVPPDLSPFLTHNERNAQNEEKQLNLRKRTKFHHDDDHQDSVEEKAVAQKQREVDRQVQRVVKQLVEKQSSTWRAKETWCYKGFIAEDRFWQLFQSEFSEPLFALPNEVKAHDGSSRQMLLSMPSVSSLVQVVRRTAPYRQVGITDGVATTTQWDKWHSHAFLEFRSATTKLLLLPTPSTSPSAAATPPGQPFIFDGQALSLQNGEPRFATHRVLVTAHFDALGPTPYRRTFGDFSSAAAVLVGYQHLVAFPSASPNDEIKKKENSEDEDTWFGRKLHHEKSRDPSQKGSSSVEWLLLNGGRLSHATLRKWAVNHSGVVTNQRGRATTEGEDSPSGGKLQRLRFAVHIDTLRPPSSFHQVRRHHYPVSTATEQQQLLQRRYKLYVVTSKPLKDFDRPDEAGSSHHRTEAELFVEHLQHALAHTSIDVEVVVKKFHVAKDSLRYAHEVFAQKRIPSITLTTSLMHDHRSSSSLGDEDEDDAVPLVTVEHAHSYLMPLPPLTPLEQHQVEHCMTAIAVAIRNTIWIYHEPHTAQHKMNPTPAMQTSLHTASHRLLREVVDETRDWSVSNARPQDVQRALSFLRQKATSLSATASRSMRPTRRPPPELFSFKQIVSEDVRVLTLQDVYPDPKDDEITMAWEDGARQGKKMMRPGSSGYGALESVIVVNEVKSMTFELGLMCVLSSLVMGFWWVIG